MRNEEHRAGGEPHSFEAASARRNDRLRSLASAAAAILAVLVPLVLLAGLWDRSEHSTAAMVVAGALSLASAGVLAAFLFSQMIERRVSNERLTASRALGDLDARLLATTQKALTEQRKAASEREVLLREIYHRVKNNLQIVQSLLRLGSRDLAPDQREPFESAIRRIGAMARVHTLLYNSPDLASIDFKEYLDELVRETADGLGVQARHIRTIVDAQPLRVPLDTAMPLAFIASELITNAYKHAFPGTREGTVRVTAGPAEGGAALVVADDGVGVPEAASNGRKPLGLTMVARLVQQIGGELDEPTPGRSAFRVRFPLDGPGTPVPTPAPPLPQPEYTSH